MDHVRPHPLSPIVAHMPSTHVLHPGEIAVATRGERLETLLGSCVAVLLTDSRHTIAAMCHIVHAGRPGPGHSDDTAFAGPAMIRMFALLQKTGITPTLCKAYVFGGGNMFPQMPHVVDVGGLNARWVMGFLQEHHMALAHADTGGTSYRKVAWTVGPTAPEAAVEAVNIATIN